MNIDHHLIAASILLVAGPGVLAGALVINSLSVQPPLVAVDQVPSAEPRRPDGPTLWLDDTIDLPEIVIVGSSPYSGEPIRIGTTEMIRYCFEHELQQGSGHVLVCEEVAK